MGEEDLGLGDQLFANMNGASEAVITDSKGFVTEGALSVEHGMMLGTGIVLLYTLFGGMWSVAVTDFLQMMMIVVGMIVIAFYLSDKAGGADVVINHAIDNGKFSNFWPEASLAGILGFIAAWVTMGFGSIPQQDVFQRVMSAKDEDTAVRGTVIGGVLYFLFAFIPIYLAYSAFIIDPELKFFQALFVAIWKISIPGALGVVLGGLLIYWFIYCR